MARFLTNYLLITGGLTLIVLAYPPIILLGLILLVVPGLILAAAPTAFIYGGVFSLIWFSAKRWFGARGASFIAAAITLGTMLTLSHQLDRRQIEALSKAHAGDRLPGVPAKVAGTIRIERDGSRPTLPSQIGEPPAYACDDLCATALFTPGVETVILADAPDHELTVDDSPDGQDRAAVYRLRGKGPCLHPLQPISGFGLGLTDWRDLNELKQSWRMALASGTCLERVTIQPGAMPPHADWTMRWIDTERRRPPLGYFSVQQERVTLDGPHGRVLQQTMAIAFRPAVIPYVSLMPGLAFMFWSIGLGGSYEQSGRFDSMKVLTNNTNLATTVALSSAGKATGERVRAIISQALADPSIPPDAVAFSLIAPLFWPNPTFRVIPGDVELITRMLADERVRDLGALVLPIRQLGEKAAALRKPMVDRLLNARLPEDGKVAEAVSYAFDAMPPGLFADPTPEEKSLLADPERRLMAGGLIARQADRGAAAVPDLLAIISQAYSHAGRRLYGTPQDGYAAMSALCRLGPTASSALPQLVAFIKDGTLISNDVGSRLLFTLVRLGMPTDAAIELTKPSRQDEQFLRTSLSDGNPQRHCG